MSEEPLRVRDPRDAIIIDRLWWHYVLMARLRQLTKDIYAGRIQPADALALVRRLNEYEP